MLIILLSLMVGQFEIGPNEAFAGYIRANQIQQAYTIRDNIMSNVYGNNSGGYRYRTRGRYSPNSPVIKARVEWKKAERERKLAMNDRIYQEYMRNRKKP
jgi:hypothetical protein